MLTIPLKLARRPHKGDMPIPYFVAWFVDGKQVREGTPGAVADFRITSKDKADRCITHGECWICGAHVGAHKSFVFGPIAGLHRKSVEPPSHRDCARYAVQACPHMLNPAKMVRNTNLPPDPNVQTIEEIDPDNPGMFLIWTTKRFTRDINGILDIGDPESVEWWIEGKRASRHDAEEQLGKLVARDFDGMVARAAKNPRLGISPTSYASELARKHERLRAYLPKD